MRSGDGPIVAWSLERTCDGLEGSLEAGQQGEQCVAAARKLPGRGAGLLRSLSSGGEAGPRVVQLLVALVLPHVCYELLLRSLPAPSTAQHCQHGRYPQRTARHSTAQHSTAQHGTSQHTKAHQSTPKHSTAHQSTPKHSTAQHSTAHHNISISRAGISSGGRTWGGG
jgi:hypothetical protein